mmetsp:Transcript_10311/g.21779  ORF Transcript_10311/g.21779 Transcript_10311/m.21779 type:complete len:195 (-) Transcript_10311:232-816(-)|eukprot:CAMPEP_0196139680 /NCGR_PEP_ID=MMETSP0910-20130528/6866_1 /TAXON_ID=49265 /ORGANISM="Thalassiosira rotula, Strain GSO102" /LENGTH=194 /DNA_ID=CAMNT_0041400431 /DNA_START=72 /DNA_END=656 /DNA_ORIENTATION=-
MAIPTPVLVVFGSVPIGGYLELTKGSSLISAHGSQIAAITPAIIIGTGFWTLSHGFKVGKARTKYAELAKKDGEKDVDERFMLPNLYAQGTSKHVRAFNCIQRSHQHIFETFTTAAVGGLAGALTFPICSAVSTLMYAVGRYYLSKGYSECEGDASERYKYRSIAVFMWYGLLGNTALGMASCALIMSGKKTLG